MRKHLPPSVRHAGKPAAAHLPPPAASPREGREPARAAKAAKAKSVAPSISAIYSPRRGREPAQTERDAVETPASIGAMHRRDRVLSPVAGALSDAALDAGRRAQRALGVLPRELRQLTELFLMPEDHPFSLERCAAIVREDRRAAAYGIRIALSLLARHYGYST